MAGPELLTAEEQVKDFVYKLGQSMPWPATSRAAKRWPSSRGTTPAFAQALRDSHADLI